jgi:hypothetical protein
MTMKFYKQSFTASSPDPKTEVDLEQEKPAEGRDPLTTTDKDTKAKQKQEQKQNDHPGRDATGAVSPLLSATSTCQQKEVKVNKDGNKKFSEDAHTNESPSKIKTDAQTVSASPQPFAVDETTTNAHPQPTAADLVDDETETETCCSKKSRSSKQKHRKLFSSKKRRDKKDGKKSKDARAPQEDDTPGTPRARTDGDLSKSLPTPLSGAPDVMDDNNTNVADGKEKKEKAVQPVAVKHTKTTESLVERVLRIGTLPEKYASSNEHQGSTLRVLLNELYRQGMDTLQVEDLLELIRWTTQYQQSASSAVNRHHGARSFDSDSLAQGEENEALLRALLSEYQLRVKRQVRKWLSVTSFEQDAGVAQNPDGHLVTSDPEDILYVINAELEVALEYLPAANAVHLMVVMFRELELMQARIQYIIDTDGVSVDLARLCAIVNDSCRMSEKCVNLELLEGGIRGAIPSFEVKNKASQVEKGYLELAVHAAYAIEAHIFHDVDPLLHKIFTNEWESGDLVPTSLATMNDYFLDLSEWIQPLFLGKCARRAFDDFLQHYLLAFFAPDKKAKMSLDVVCYMLEKDRLYMIESFGGDRMLEILKQSGLRDAEAIIDRVEIFRAISNILKSHDPEEASNDIDVVLRDLGNQTGTVAIMYLVQIRKGGYHTQTHHHFNNIHEDDHNEEMVTKWKAAVVAACKTNPSGNLRRRIVCDLKHLIRPYHLQVFNMMNPFSEDQDFVTNMVLMPNTQNQSTQLVKGHGHGQQIVDHFKSNMNKIKSPDHWKSQIDKAKLKVEASVRQVQERASFTTAAATRPPSPTTIRAIYQSERENIKNYIKKSGLSTRLSNSKTSKPAASQSPPLSKIEVELEQEKPDEGRDPLTSTDKDKDIRAIYQSERENIKKSGLTTRRSK